jgi:hypothetical protein
LSHFETVKFINFQYEQANKDERRGINWILLLLNEPSELGMVIG